MSTRNGYHETVSQPAINDWHELIRSNQETANAASAMIASDDRQPLRRKVLEAARDFTNALNDRANDAGIQVSTDFVSKLCEDLSADSAPIVMTGHQPTIFHPGIAFKYDITAGFAQCAGATAIAVTIDTDTGDAGEILLPVADDDSLRLERVSLSDNPGLFLSQQLGSEAAIRRVGTRMSEELRNLGFAAEADCAAVAIDQYARLSGGPVVEANAMVRRSFGVATKCLEIPLSTILTFPESQCVFSAIFADSRRFMEVYNKTLTAYRTSRKIRNVANPFPNLRNYDEAVELPFWVIDLKSGDRAPLFIEPTRKSLLLSTRHGPLCEIPCAEIAKYTEFIGDKHLIAPRGPMITALLRLALSDLFVHGTGGGKYDRFTDAFIRAYWFTEPPTFTVASATRYLFKQQREEAHELKGFERELREMTSHIQRYFGTNTFSLDVESELRNIVDARTELVESLMQAKRLRQPATNIGRNIKQLDGQIDSVIRHSLAPRIARLEQLTPNQLGIYDTRGFPYFYFSAVPKTSSKGQSRRDLCCVT